MKFLWLLLVAVLFVAGRAADGDDIAETCTSCKGGEGEAAQCDKIYAIAEGTSNFGCLKETCGDGFTDKCNFPEATCFEENGSAEAADYKVVQYNDTPTTVFKVDDFATLVPQVYTEFDATVYDGLEAMTARVCQSIAQDIVILGASPKPTKVLFDAGASTCALLTASSEEDGVADIGDTPLSGTVADIWCNALQTDEPTPDETDTPNPDDEPTSDEADTPNPDDEPTSDEADTPNPDATGASDTDTVLPTTTAAGDSSTTSKSAALKVALPFVAVFAVLCAA